MGLGAVGTGAALVLAEIRHWEALLRGALLAQAGPAELGGWGCLPARAPPPTWAQTKWPNQRWPKPIALSWGLACAKSWQLTKETPTTGGHHMRPPPMLANLKILVRTIGIELNILGSRRRLGTSETSLKLVSLHRLYVLARFFTHRLPYLCLFPIIHMRNERKK